MLMTREDFSKTVLRAVERYIADEEVFDDHAQLTVNPTNLEIDIVDGDEDIPDDIDQYDVMDLLTMGMEGHWQPDAEAIASLAEEYID